MTKQILEHTQEKTTNAKKGGPYTKQEKLNRHNQVYQLYFEKDYSAVRIAEELGVNRNAINSDIKTLYLQFADELPEHEMGALFLSQLHAFKDQKARLVEKLEKQTEPKIQLQFDQIKCHKEYGSET